LHFLKADVPEKDNEMNQIGKYGIEFPFAVDSQKLKGNPYETVKKFRTEN
jgi:hypothetical protein